VPNHQHAILCEVDVTLAKALQTEAETHGRSERRT
jgi:hypothetical protein